MVAAVVVVFGSCYKLCLRKVFAVMYFCTTRLWELGGNLGFPSASRVDSSLSLCLFELPFVIQPRLLQSNNFAVEDASFAITFELEIFRCISLVACDFVAEANDSERVCKQASKQASEQKRARSSVFASELI